MALNIQPPRSELSFRLTQVCFGFEYPFIVCSIAQVAHDRRTAEFQRLLFSHKKLEEKYEKVIPVVKKAGMPIIFLVISNIVIVLSAGCRLTLWVNR